MEDKNASGNTWITYSWGKKKQFEMKQIKFSDYLSHLQIKKVV